jgi:signal peptidase II
VSASGSGLGRAAIVALAALGLDQVTKAIVRTEIQPGESIDLFAGIHLVRVSNEGIAFGMLDDAGDAVLVIAAVAFAVLLGLFLVSAERPGLWLPIGLLAGGAVGNLIDRIREGAVTDFIDPPSWPAFNVADIEITAGVVILVAIFLFGAEPEPEPEARAESP